MSSMEQRQRAEKTMKRQGRSRRSTNLVVWTSDNYFLCFFREFEWRVSHFKFSLSSTILLIWISAQVLRGWKCTNQTSMTKVKRIEHSRKITFWVSASFVNIYICVCWLWITAWSEVQIGVDDVERKGKKQKRVTERKTNLMKLVIHVVIIWSSFTSKQGHWNEKKINVTLKPQSFVFHQD